MKETTKSTLVQLDLIHPETGEVTKIEGSSIESKKYYSIKNITSRINAMDLLTMMEQTCKAPRDIRTLNILLDLVGDDNKIRIDNISLLAKDMQISRSKLNGLIKSFVDINFFRKLDRGIYFVNPFIFVGRRVRSNEKRENAQSEWSLAL